MRVRAMYSIVVLSLVGAIPVRGQEASKGSPTAVISGGPQVGRRAPDFTLAWAGRDGVGPADSPYQLWRDRGKTVVIAFYPRDFTSGCTAQMRTFSEQYDSLFGGDVVVVGINADSLTTHSRFASSLGLPFRLLTDPEQKVARKYGSGDNTGRPKRTVFVVAPDGRVAYRNMKFNALDPKHYAELGAAVRAARGG
jgi:thioredoxin-dependent peroxiredoxin